MEPLFNDQQKTQIKSMFEDLRSQGKSINKSLETIADKMFCDPSTARNYVYDHPYMQRGKSK